MTPARVVVVVAAAVAVAGCEPEIDTDPLSGLLRGEAQRQALCARARDNTVTRAFCGTRAPDIESLDDVLHAIGLGFDQPDRPGFALTANSTALAARSVSAINPRAVIVKEPGERDDGSFVALGYARGDQVVEMAVRAANSDDTALYLLRYEQRCNSDDAGCGLADLLTPATESDWRSFSLYDDEDLKNTILDCRACHQPAGPATRVDFRMQEFQNPWTHWIAAFGDGENALFHDYTTAHAPDESYAAIPTDFLVAGNPIDVESFFKDSGSEEPNPFPSQIIEDEVKASSPLQPSDNSKPGESPTWDALYERAVNGEVIPPPYHDVKITDASKLAAAAAGYESFMRGDIGRDDFPDIRDVVADHALADLSRRPRPGLDGRGILIHMCAQCHNDRLDQSLSRARFNPFHLDQLSRAEKDAAIDRLQRPPEDRFRMPPHLLRDLDDDALQKALAVLRR